MSNYVDHFDVIDAENHVTPVFIQDRDTLALATENLNKINALTTRVSTNEDNISEINGVVSGHTTSISQLSTSLQQEITNRTNADTNINNSLQQEITNRTNADNSIKESIIGLNKHVADGIIILIGDSYVRFHNDDSYAIYLCDALGKTLNTDFFIFEIGGSGFVASNLGKNFNDLLNDSVTQLSNNASKVSMVIFAGGTNDVGLNGVENTCALTLSNAKNAYPNACVCVFNIDGSVKDAEPRAFLDMYYANGCCRSGASYNNVSGILKINPSAMMNDNIHPTAYGEKLIFGALYTTILGGKISCSNPYINIGTGLDYPFYVNANTEIAHISVVPNNGVIAFATSSAVTCDGTNVLAEYNIGNSEYPNILKGNNSEFVGGTGHCLLHVANSDWVMCDIYVTASNSKIIIKPLVADSNGWYVIPASSIVEMASLSFDICIPTLMI